MKKMRRENSSGKKAGTGNNDITTLCYPHTDTCDARNISELIL